MTSYLKNQNLASKPKLKKKVVGPGVINEAKYNQSAARPQWNWMAGRMKHRCDRERIVNVFCAQQHLLAVTVARNFYFD